jgi:hypothetical protein
MRNEPYKPGHIVIGRYVSYYTVRDDGLVHELRTSFNSLGLRVDLYKAAEETQKILERIMQ